MIFPALFFFFFLEMLSETDFIQMIECFALVSEYLSGRTLVVIETTQITADMQHYKSTPPI